MGIKEAIQILKDHNVWRRFDNEDSEIPEMTDPKKLGIAIDKVVNEFENLLYYKVSSSANDFEKELFELINAYCKKGLKKPDLVKKMEWVLGSCKMS